MKKFKKNGQRWEVWVSLRQITLFIKMCKTFFHEDESLISKTKKLACYAYFF